MSPNEIVIATHNDGKLFEIRALLAYLDLNVTSSKEYGLTEPIENAPDFTGNALIKAKYVARATNKIALADDSGLSVNALGGKPGIYSARWAGNNKDFSFAMKRIENELLETGLADYSASFFCALALAEPNGKESVFLGEVKGKLTFPPRGTFGFGYDPIFIADNMNETFAELTPHFKHSISHRADAFKKLTCVLDQIFDKKAV